MGRAGRSASSGPARDPPFPVTMPPGSPRRLRGLEASSGGGPGGLAGPFCRSISAGRARGWGAEQRRHRTHGQGSGRPGRRTADAGACGSCGLGCICHMWTNACQRALSRGSPQENSVERRRPAWKSSRGSASCWEKPGAWVCGDRGKKTGSCHLSCRPRVLGRPPLPARSLPAAPGRQLQRLRSELLRPSTDSCQSEWRGVSHSVPLRAGGRGASPGQPPARGPTGCHPRL